MTGSRPTPQRALLRATLGEIVAHALGPGFLPPEPEEPLLSSGLIDSLGLTGLLQQLADRLDIVVAPLDVTLENFDTLARIEAFVMARL